jgi:urease
MALYGSFLPTPSTDLFPAVNEADFHPLAMPGAISPAQLGAIVLHPGRARVSVTVTNKGTRGCYVSSIIQDSVPSLSDTDLISGRLTLSFHGDQS